VKYAFSVFICTRSPRVLIALRQRRNKQYYREYMTGVFFNYPRRYLRTEYRTLYFNVRSIPYTSLYQINPADKRVLQQNKTL